MRFRTLALGIALAAALGAPAARAQDTEEYSRLFQLGIDQLQAKKYDESVESFKKAIAINSNSPESYYNIACAYSLKGEKDKAIDWLAESFAHGFDDEKHIAADKDLDPIREEPRFKELMAKTFAKPAPGQSLVTLKGEPASLDKLRGKVVVLDFWRTWCEPCKQHIPGLIALSDQYAAQGLVVVGVSNEPVKLQETLADELKMNYTLLRQVGDMPAPFENVKAFPTTVILDREGKVVKKLVGARDKAELEALVKPLLVPEKKESEPQVF